MADVTITTSAVRSSDLTEALKKRAISGYAFSAGQPLFQDPDTGKLGPCGTNDTDAANTLKGIALCSCPGANQPAFYVTDDALFEPGFTPVEGEVYVVSATPGRICPIGDLGPDDRVNIVGVGKAAGKFRLACDATGITKA